MNKQITDVYFRRSKDALLAAGINPTVLYNVFIRSERNYTLCGITEAATMILEASTPAQATLNKVNVLYPDGSTVLAGHTSVLTYEGPLLSLIQLETAVCATISAQSTAATTMGRIVKAAKGKLVFYFGTRH